MTRSFAALVLSTLILPAAAAAQATPPLSAELQITTATAPLPEQFRADAAVLGYAPGATALTTLRPGVGAYVCLADDPADERFHVACYHRALEPMMARGRELRAQGRAEEVERVRTAEATARTLSLPSSPAALYSLTGTAEHVDRSTGAVSGARALYVVYVPFATAESTGLPTKAAQNAPWLMFPGTYRAHIMFVPRM